MTMPIALTCGDPSGVGPEITLKAWQSLRHDTSIFLISDFDHTHKIGQKHGVPVVQIEHPDETKTACPKALPVLHNPFVERPKVGQEHHANAPSTVRSIETAVKFVQHGDASAVVTNPINKKVLKDGADFAFPGHTEFLAALAGVGQSYMMLTAPELRVVPVTIHIPLADVSVALTADLLMQTIKETDQALKRDFGIQSPRLSIAGLNPHAGEGGAMGHEDQSIIAPVIRQAVDMGMDVSGPYPADTMFHPSAREKYDVAICMYHDQALIPLKTLNFSQGVNTTLGLPFIRTSPDHGTAFDIAGKGKADADSLIAAIQLAAEMASYRSAYDAT